VGIVKMILNWFISRINKNEKMKKIMLFILLVGLYSNAQKITYNKINEAGKYNEYQTKSGDILKIGDTIQINYPLSGDFVFITQGDFKVDAHLSNSKIVVAKIKAVGNPNRGFKAYVFFKGYGFNVAIDYEAALETGEIKNSFPLNN
jgi:hypothetical protein